MKGSACAQIFPSTETKEWIGGAEERKNKKMVLLRITVEACVSVERGGGGALNAVCLWLIPAALSECITIN